MEPLMQLLSKADYEKYLQEIIEQRSRIEALKRTRQILISSDDDDWGYTHCVQCHAKLENEDPEPDSEDSPWTFNMCSMMCFKEYEQENPNHQEQ